MSHLTAYKAPFTDFLMVSLSLLLNYRVLQPVRTLLNVIWLAHNRFKILAQERVEIQTVLEHLGDGFAIRAQNTAKDGAFIRIYPGFLTRSTHRQKHTRLCLDNGFDCRMMRRRTRLFGQKQCLSRPMKSLCWGYQRRPRNIGRIR